MFLGKIAIVATFEIYGRSHFCSTIIYADLRSIDKRAIDLFTSQNYPQSSYTTAQQTQVLAKVFVLNF